MSSQLVTSNGHDLFAMALETQELPSKNQFSPNFTVSSQLVTPNGHDLFAMALETQDLPSQNQFSPNMFKLAKCNTRPSRSKPVQSQCVQTCQVQKDNVVSSKAAVTQTRTPSHLHTTVVHSPCVSIQHLLRFRWKRFNVGKKVFFLFATTGSHLQPKGCTSSRHDLRHPNPNVIIVAR